MHCSPAAKPLLRQRARALAAVMLIACAAPTTWAAPDPATADPVLRLLQDRGVVETAASQRAAAEAAAATVQPGQGNADTAGTEALSAERHAAPSTLLQRMRDRATDMVLASMRFLGVPYRRGGNSAETGFDCSGFTRHVFESSLGLILPRRAEEQAKAKGLMQVARDELKPGDLVFFNTLRRTFSHVGIYVGDNKFIHAPRTGAVVRVEDMRIAYWTQRYNGARRVPQAADAQGASAAQALGEAGR